MDIIKDWGQIAGVAGIALGVFLILFREVIRQSFFPKLKEKHGFIIVLIFMFFVWSVAIYSLSKYIKQPPKNMTEEFIAKVVASNPDQTESLESLRWWVKREGKKFSSQPNIEQRYVTAWEQWFDKGRALYLVTEGVAIIFHNDTTTYHKYPTPQALITNGPGNININDTVVSELLENVPTKWHGKYIEALKNKKLLGGIGTLYIANNLLPKLGNPITQETIDKDILYAKADTYELLAGVFNREGDSDTRAVYLLKEDNSFKKYTKYHSN